MIDYCDSCLVKILKTLDKRHIKLLNYLKEKKASLPSLGRTLKNITNDCEDKDFTFFKVKKVLIILLALGLIEEFTYNKEKLYYLSPSGEKLLKIFKMILAKNISNNKEKEITPITLPKKKKKITKP